MQAASLKAADIINTESYCYYCKLLRLQPAGTLLILVKQLATETASLYTEAASYWSYCKLLGLTATDPTVKLLRMQAIIYQHVKRQATDTIL